jgi:hypothetical protein
MNIFHPHRPWSRSDKIFCVCVIAFTTGLLFLPAILP